MNSLSLLGTEKMAKLASLCVVWAKFNKKIDLNMIQASQKQFQKEKSVNFQGKFVSRVTP